MSDFSAVDRSARPDRLVEYLRSADRGLSAMKRYQAAALARLLPEGALVVDVGCGLGHDVLRLEAEGLVGIGVDTSEVMLAEAPPEVERRAKADGAALPFRTGSLDGCRIERVLQHVEDPAAVVAEVRRVVRRDGGAVTVFEPDYRTMRVPSEVDPTGDLVARHLRVRHPAIGGEAAGLLERHGFVIDDIVTEHSFGRSLDSFPVDVHAVLGRVADRELADRWLAEQRACEEAGALRYELCKVLTVARSS